MPLNKQFEYEEKLGKQGNNRKQRPSFKEEENKVQIPDKNEEKLPKSTSDFFSSTKSVQYHKIHEFDDSDSSIDEQMRCGVSRGGSEVS